MSLLEYIDKWNNSIKTYLEDELGPIPEFEYRGYKDSRFVDFAFRIKVKNKKPIIVLYEDNFNQAFYQYLRSPKMDLKEHTFGRLIFGLVHELVHVYQMRPLIEKAGFVRSLLYKTMTHCNWVEGLAQLYAFKICDRIYREAKDEGSSLVNIHKEENIEEAICNLLNQKRYKKSLGVAMSKTLYLDTRLLINLDLIGNHQFSFSNYPFEIDTEILNTVKKKRASDPKIKFNTPTQKMPFEHYILGPYQLSKIISKGLYPMEDLIKTPLSNKELKKLLEK